LALPTERVEAILHGMQSGYEFFGCVPREVWWDNPTTVATAILSGTRTEGDVPLGTLVEILIGNRLLVPKALFRVGEWAEQASLTEYYGVPQEQLNDDRLGRALERLQLPHSP
jgi:hypothetical protein